MYKCISLFSFEKSQRIKIENADRIELMDVIFFCNDMEQKSYMRRDPMTGERKQMFYTRGGYKIVKLSDEDPNKVDCVLQQELMEKRYVGQSLVGRGRNRRWIDQYMSVPSGKYAEFGEELFSFPNGNSGSWQITKVPRLIKRKLTHCYKEMTPNDLLNDIVYLVKWEYENNKVEMDVTKKRLELLDRTQKFLNLALRGVGGEKENAQRVFNSLIYKTTEEVCQI